MLLPGPGELLLLVGFGSIVLGLVAIVMIVVRFVLPGSKGDRRED